MRSAFYRDSLGFEVRNDVGDDGMRWIMVGPASQPSTSVVWEPPAADPSVTDDERRAMAELMAKGRWGIILATADLDGTFERVQASGAEVVQEPTEQAVGGSRLRLPILRATRSASTSCAEPSCDRSPRPTRKAS